MKRAITIELDEQVIADFERAAAQLGRPQTIDKILVELAEVSAKQLLDAIEQGPERMAEEAHKSVEDFRRGLEQHDAEHMIDRRKPRGLA